jgi:deazaflavin-dependent oxidoreductase (nitroreductase family)
VTLRERFLRLNASPAAGWWVLNVATPIDRRLIPATNGRVRTAPWLPLLVMESTGAKSGRPRRTPLLYVRDGEELAVIASATGKQKHPAWFHNVRKDPNVRVWAPGGRSGEYVARVAEGEERERMWRRATEVYPGYDDYAERAGAREIPVVALSPRRG